jgi:hypothetical protein
LLVALEDQSQQMVAQDDPGAWARQAQARVQEWLGSSLQEPGSSAGPRYGAQVRKSKLTRALEGAAAHLAEVWEQRLTEAAVGLQEHPGRRLAVAEAALSRFQRYCDEAAATHRSRCPQPEARTGEANEQLQTALENCIIGVSGWSWFGGRARRLLRVFMDHLAAYARQCLAEDTAAALQQFYALLRGRLGDRLRDLTLCRQRLRYLVDQLGDVAWDAGSEDDLRAGGPHGDLSPTPVLSAEEFWESIRASATMRVVLPDRAKDLEHAARHFLQTLTAEQWSQLDQAFGDQVLAPRGGLQKACLGTTDLLRHLAAPLLTQAAASLGDHLPVTDVAEVELSHSEGDGPGERGLAERIQAYHVQATPLLRGREAGHPAVAGPRNGEQGDNALAPGGSGLARAPGEGEDSGFLLIPASESGKVFGQLGEKAVAGLQLVNVPGQADLMFCREQLGLSAEDLEKILASCRAAYLETAMTPPSSPHARFDIQDWTPLDP